MDQMDEMVRLVTLGHLEKKAALANLAPREGKESQGLLEMTVWMVRMELLAQRVFLEHQVLPEERENP